jgi:hypothetical protein
MRPVIRASLALVLSFSMIAPLPAKATAASTLQDGVQNPAELVAPLASASESKRTEASKRFYVEAEAHASAFEWQAAIAKYEAAYILSPDKHGLAYKVAMAAWRTGDCFKAKDFFEQLIAKGSDQEKLASKIQEANEILAEIERQGCASGSGTKKKNVAPLPADGQESTGSAEPPMIVEDEPAAPSASDNEANVPTEPDTVDDIYYEENPLGPSSKARRDAQRDKADRSRRPGLLATGITFTVLGVGGLATGGVFTITGSQKANTLRSLATQNPKTLFPARYYARCDGASECPRDLISGLERDNQLALIGYAVGGGLALVGVTFIVTRAILRARDRREVAASGKSRPSLVLAPMLAPRSAGIGALGHF